MAVTMIAFLPLLLIAAAIGQEVNWVDGDPNRFKYVNMQTPLSGPCDVSEGPDGMLYIQELLANRIARYNPDNDELVEFDIPFSTPLLPNRTFELPSAAKAAFLTCALRNGFDGKLYLSNGNRNQLVQHDTKTGVTKVFTPPGLLRLLGNLEPLNDVAAAPDGIYMSQTTSNSIVKFDYNTEKFTYFQVPTLLANPLGMYYAQDGAVWFLEFAGQKVGRLDRTTGAITEYPVPITALGPTVMRAETQDEHGDWLLWFACTVGNGIASINQRTKKIKFYSEKHLSLAVEVAQDYNDNVWITHLLENVLGVYNPREDRFTEIRMPQDIVSDPVGLPPYIGTGIYSKPVGNPFTRGTGNYMWFTQLTANRLVRYDLEGLEY